MEEKIVTKRIRIVSEGTGRSTHVYDGQGESIPMVRKVTFEVEEDKVATATLEVLLPHIDITVDANIVEVDPYNPYKTVNQY